MTVLGVLYSLFLMPLQLILEELYIVCFCATGNPGTAVALLGLLMCVPVLPLAFAATRFAKEPPISKAAPARILKPLAPVFFVSAFFAASAVFIASMDMVQNVALGPIANIGAASIPLSVTIGALGFAAAVALTWSSPRSLRIGGAVAAVVIVIILCLSPAATSIYWGVFCLASFLTVLATRSLPKRDSAKPCRFRIADTEPSFATLIASGAFLAVLVGCFVPSQSILPSTSLFLEGTAGTNPTAYLASSAAIAIGAFVIWPALTYLVLSKRGRAALNVVMVIACVAAAVNCVSFCDALTEVDGAMALGSDPALKPLEIAVNTVSVLAASVVVALLYKPLRKVFQIALPVAIVTLAILFMQNVGEISAAAVEALASSEETQQEAPSFTLSKTGKNVVVIMIDRGMSVYVPYIMNERPELKKSFDGFTYYPNTVSYSGKTIVSSSCFYGGYDYTPEENFRNDDKTTTEKQNESLLMMPVMFDSEGYETTVLDPTFANYGWTPDLSIFDDYPTIKAYNARGSFETPEQDQQVAVSNLRNTFCYGLMRSAPVCLRPLLYYGGTYNQTDSLLKAGFQTTSDNVLVAYGQRSAFVEAIRTLQEMCNMTLVTGEKKNTFLMMSCDSAHDIATLQEPSYTSEPAVDNTEYESEHADRLTVDGVTLNMDTQVQVSHYQCNMATFIELAKWLDYLKEEGVYDNTRIVIGADHGFTTAAVDGRIIDVENPADNDGYYDIEHYHPLLMVKDFNSTGFTTDETFMTHADVPTLTTQGVIENPVNPFTGNKVESTAEDKEVVNVFSSYNWAPWWNTGYTLNENNTHWFSVHDDVRDSDNWTEIENPVTKK